MTRAINVSLGGELGLQAKARGHSMPPEPSDRAWNSMKSDRELIELAKTHTLRTLAEQLQRPPAAILRKATRLGLSIKRKADPK
jgi:hypothetical protein